VHHPDGRIHRKAGINPRNPAGDWLGEPDAHVPAVEDDVRRDHERVPCVRRAEGGGRGWAPRWVGRGNRSKGSTDDVAGFDPFDAECSIKQDVNESVRDVLGRKQVGS